MTNDERNIKSDYDYSRETYYDLLEKGRGSLEDMIEVARSSEHPRAYEVLSGMIKNLSDVNDKLMDLNKKNKDINQEEVKQIAGGTTNNVFLGSTADLQRLLQDEKDIIDVTPESK
jgi:recombinational DNA repair protein RecR